MWKKCSLLASLLFATFTTPATEYYAAPNGRPGANGSLASPWNLQTALAQPASVVRPGDTIWLRGGSYTGPAPIWNASLNGSSLAPIIVRQFPGERATVNGGLYVGGSWTWYWGFEITNPDPQRNVTNNFARPEGIEIHGRGCKAINLIVHDTGHPGLGFWKQIGDGAEVYGCILWGNGIYDYSSGSRTIRGAGIYGQGETRDENRYIKDSIFFRNFTQGIHLYSTGAGVYINGLHIEGNFLFNNGDAKENLFVGTVAQPCERISILDNCTYFNPGDNGTGIRLGYDALNNTGLEVRGNTVLGGSTSLLLNEWQNVTITDNSLLGSRQRLVQISRTGGFPTFDYLCNNNGYASTYANPFVYSDSQSFINFARWKSDTGYDANSTFASTLPTPAKVIVRPNQYERGRAHVAVCNGGLQPTVSIDLSTAGLNMGEGYEIRDVQNYFGPPVATGTYNGSTVTLPMNLTSTPALIGNVDHMANRHTAADFNAFVVVPLATPPAPITLSGVLPALVTETTAIIVWNTDVPADSQIDYGTNTGYGLSTTLDSALTTDHGMQLTDLLPGTTYHFLARSRNVQGSLATSPDIMFQTPAAPITEKLYIPIEAESGTLTSPTRVASDGQASQGQCLVSASGGAAAFTLNIPAAGDYYIWSRVISPSSNNDSFYVSFDGGPEDIFDTAENKWSPLWQWSRVNGRGGANPLTLNPRLFTLAEGPHTLVFRTRDPVVSLDRLLITNDPDFVAGTDPLTATPGAVLSMLIRPGYSLIANPFDRGGNTVAEIMPAVPEGTRLYKFDNTIQSFVPNRFLGGRWNLPRQTLPPGEGAYLLNATAAPFNLLLTGQLRDANTPLTISSGLSVVSARVLRTLPVQDVLGFAPLPGDAIARFDSASSTFKWYAYDSDGWDASAVLRLGEAVFLQLQPR